MNDVVQTNAATEPEIGLFDPGRPVEIVRRRLPHWSQAGAASFVTWRTHDSMPRHVVEGWERERAAVLARHGIDADAADWPARLRKLAPTLQIRLKSMFAEAWNERLDQCHGACVLRQPVLTRIVEDSLRHFDDERDILLDFVIMPNHVHLIAVFHNECDGLAQCESWKHFTAVAINRVLARRGKFWQSDGFDHLVRSEEQLEYLRKYIASNPERAGLKMGEYARFSRPIGEGG